MTNLIQHFMVSMTKFMTGMVSMTLKIIQLRLGFNKLSLKEANIINANVSNWYI